MKKFEFTQDYEENRKGDITEYQEGEIYHTIQHPLLMRGVLRDTEKELKKQEIKSKEKENLDLNKDGIIDSKDSSIAGKVLANRRYTKKGDK